MNTLGIHIVSNVDQLTIIAGFLVTLAKIVVRRVEDRRPYASFSLCAVDFLNGCLLAPFGALALSVFSPSIMHDLQTTNAAILSIAGAIGMMFVVGEVLD